MSHDNSAIKNKQQKHSKVHFDQYLFNSGEPRDVVSRDTLHEQESALLENSYDMRQDFRHVAAKMRE